MTATATSVRELDHRRNDGIDATPLWDARTDRLSLAVVDEGSGESLTFRVDPTDALIVFHHPYAYAAGRRRVMSSRRDSQRDAGRRA